MAFTNRATLRADLLTKLKTRPKLADTGGQAHVYDYLAKDFQGMSPICCADSMGVKYDVNGDDDALTPFRFVIGFWVDRSTASNAESILDELALALANLLQGYYLADFIQPSTSDYETLGGITYKFELHFVEINY